MKTQPISFRPEAPRVEVPHHPTWPQLSPTEKTALQTRIKALLREQNAVLVAHYYVDGDLQALAEETGGCVADSLEMARYGTRTDADTLVVCGVRFMGETAKILNPEKRVLMPDLSATCSLCFLVSAGSTSRRLARRRKARSTMLPPDSSSSPSSSKRPGISSLASTPARARSCRCATSTGRPRKRSPMSKASSSAGVPRMPCPFPT